MNPAIELAHTVGAFLNSTLNEEQASTLECNDLDGGAFELIFHSEAHRSYIAIVTIAANGARSVVGVMPMARQSELKPSQAAN